MVDYRDAKLALEGKDIQVISADNLSFDKYVKMMRGADAEPTIVIKPKDEEQLQQTVETLNKLKLGAVIYAGATGLVSAQRAEGNAVIDVNSLDQLTSIKLSNGKSLLFSEKDSKLLPVKQADVWQEELQTWLAENSLTKEDCKDAEVDCQAGLSLGSLNHVLKPANIEIPVDTGAVIKGGGMTVGGGVANATHGTYGLMHGTMSDLVVEANSINGDGTLRSDKGPNPSERVVPEDSTVINSAIAQYGNSAIGTQGTFALVVNAKLRTTSIPEEKHIFMVKTDNLEEVNNLRQSLQEQFPKNVRQFEIMNQFATELVKKFEPSNFINPFTDEMGNPVGNDTSIDSKYIAMVELIEPPAGVEDLGMEAFAIIESLGYGFDKVAYAGGEMGANPEEFFKLRHAVSASSTGYGNRLGGANEHRVSPDVSVPLNQLDSYANELIGTLTEQGYEASVFGHVGIGAFHLHVYSPEDMPLSEKVDGDITRKEQLISTIYDITEKCKGSCWSEHGVGTAAAHEWDKRTPKEEVDKWFAYKLEADPNNTLNPQSNGMDKQFARLKTAPDRQAEMKAVAESLGLDKAVALIDSMDKGKGGFAERFA